MKLTYREQIIQTLNNLIETREIIFEQIVNLAMSNEYSGLHNTFEIGETYNFTLNHFKKMEDINVRKIVTLCKNSEKTIDLLHLSPALNYRNQQLCIAAGTHQCGTAGRTRMQRVSGKS